MLNRLLFRAFCKTSQIQQLNRSLTQADPEMRQIIEGEQKRQTDGLNLIASENHCSKAVLETLASVMNSKYSEGYPGQRYYGGTKYVDMAELLCQKRALQAFGLKPEEWGVNVQSLSGSPANFAVYTGLLNTHDRIMSLDLPHGGHLSHGYQTAEKKISAVSKYFEVLPYRVNQTTGIIDYDSVYNLAQLYRPKLIVAGASAYSRLIDFKKFRQVCDSVNAYLLADISHPAGLMAAGVIPGPFAEADVVTTTTHKTLRGTRGALIYYKVGSKKDKKGNEIKYDLKQKIDSAVFPGLQGGPHNHSIAAIAVTLKEVQSAEFKQYQKQTVANANAMAQKLLSLGYDIVAGGTDIHLLMIDLRKEGVDGARVQLICNEVNLYVNKNTVPGDKSALMPHGLRLGSPSLTTRGVKESDMCKIMEFIDRAIKLTKLYKKEAGPKLVDFKAVIEKNLESTQLKNLKNDIRQLAKKFPVPAIP